MSKKTFRIALLIVSVTVAIALGLGAYAVDTMLEYPDRQREGSGQAIAVEIERGMGFPSIARRLHDKGVVDNPRFFRLYAMQQGATTKVRAGEYELRDNMSPRQVLETLLAGVEDVTVRITIPEGLNMLEVFALLAEAGIADAKELEALGRSRDFLDAHGIGGPTVEGFLFPETYRFRAPTEPKVVIERMIEQHRKVWDRIRREHADSVARVKKKLDWTDREILIMASIVEKESVVDSERPRIAQVFMNRLLFSSFVPHRLDTDPTIRYGCTVPTRKSKACQEWDPGGRLYRAQLDDKDNLYNTYQHEGLPPGPICNPGERALRATVNPDGSRFLFFVSRNDGTHVFSRTRREHERWVDKYQR